MRAATAAAEVYPEDTDLSAQADAGEQGIEAASGPRESAEAAAPAAAIPDRPPLGTSQIYSQIYSIRLEFFSGPMDLLLHLVSQQEVDIEHVQMSVIAEQYLAIVLEQAQRLDLDRATEYLVIAATLLAIKSGSLLPAEAAPEVEQGGEDYEANRFFHDLRERLKAYEATKTQAQALLHTPQFGVDTFSRADRKELQPTPEMLAEPEDVQELGILFSRLLGRVGLSREGLRISRDSISIVNFMMSIVDSLRGSVKTLSRSGDSSVLSSGAAAGKRTLSQLIKEMMPVSLVQRLARGERDRQTKGEVRGVVIGSFIAVLELMKRGLMDIPPAEAEQRQSGSDSLSLGLQLRMDDVEGEFDTSHLESEFDGGSRSEDLQALSDAPESEIPPMEVSANDKSSNDKIVQMSDYVLAINEKSGGGKPVGENSSETASAEEEPADRFQEAVGAKK